MDLVYSATEGRAAGEATWPSSSISPDEVGVRDTVHRGEKIVQHYRRLKLLVDGFAVESARGVVLLGGCVGN